MGMHHVHRVQGEWHSKTPEYMDSHFSRNQNTCVAATPLVKNFPPTASTIKFLQNVRREKVTYISVYFHEVQSTNQQN